MEYASSKDVINKIKNNILPNENLIKSYFL